MIKALRVSLVYVVMVFTVTSMTQNVHALKLDPTLHGLCVNNCEGQFPAPDIAAFKGLTRAYGLALAPPLLAPANTIGINAFEVDMSYSFTQLQDDSSSWANAVKQREAVSNLMGTHFVVRKGLPYSFELEGQLGYLVNSELWTMGGSVKWSFHEAMRVIPIDFMVRGSVNHLVGSSQLDLNRSAAS